MPQIRTWSLLFLLACRKGATIENYIDVMFKVKNNNHNLPGKGVVEVLPFFNFYV